VGSGPRTLAGLAKNLRVGIAYLEGWQRGLGCVAWDDLMEDLATLEISWAQTWQWLHHGVQLDDGPRVDRALVARLFAQEEGRIAAELAELIRDPAELALAQARFHAARVEAERIFTEPDLRPFLAEASPEVGA
jgi:malate synthase